MLLNLVAQYLFYDGLKYTEYLGIYETEIQYEVNDFLLFFSFVRIYLDYRFSFFLTEVIIPRTLRVCAMNGYHADWCVRPQIINQVLSISDPFWEPDDIDICIFIFIMNIWGSNIYVIQ